MAEGSVEEDSGDMLGPTAAPILQTPTPSNMSVKDEVILIDLFLYKQ